MYFLTRQFWLAAAVASALTLSSPLAAQTTEKGPVRTVLALGRVATMIEAPMYLSCRASRSRPLPPWFIVGPTA
jgi:hypothetical protein